MENIMDILYSLLGEPQEGERMIYLIFGFVLIVLIYRLFITLIKALLGIKN